MSDGLTIEVESVDHADVAALLEAAAAYSAELYPPESRHGLDLAAHRRPDVILFVAREGDVAIGCVACQLQGDGCAEVKSMFVLPEARGRRIGRALLQAIEDALRGRVTTLRLETGIKQNAALRLYDSAGFERRGPFGRYRDDPLSVFMAKPI